MCIRDSVYTLDDIMTESIDGSGYNDTYGLLGSNKATEDSVCLLYTSHGDGRPDKLMLVKIYPKTKIFDGVL